MSYRYWLESYGCQMNRAESAALEHQLAAFQWLPASTPETADLIILNTCAVRESAEERIWGRLSYFKSLSGAHFRLAVMGCMAERLADTFQQRAPEIDFVVGNFRKTAFLNLLRDPHGLTEAGGDPLPVDETLSFADYHGRQSPGSAFVPIMQGCNNFCSYCIVPYVRGRERSRSVASIIGEMKTLAREGVKEVTLLGQNVNSYSYDEGGVHYDFPFLLETLCQSTDIPWIRFVSSHPKDLSPRLGSMMAAYPQICNQLHLPLQHGSDSVLQRMNRGYTAEDYFQKISRLRDRIPDVALSTDLLIGFPGETEADFEQTMEWIRKIQFDDAFTYYYNVRSGTPAASMPNPVPEDLQHRRLSLLIDVQRRISAAKKQSEVGQTVRVLVEKPSRKNPNEWLSRSERNRMVVFQSHSAQAGDFCRVRLTALDGATFKGEEV